MKTIVVLLAFVTIVTTSCERTHEVPSLHRQMLGKWNVESYTIERYQAITNSVSRYDVSGGNSDFMNFSTFARLYVNFDTAAPVVWIYKIVDGRTLEIEGKKWTITKLDEQYFHLSLNERDSTLKDRNVVYYHLKRSQ